MQTAHRGGTLLREEYLDGEHVCFTAAGMCANAPVQSSTWLIQTSIGRETPSADERLIAFSQVSCSSCSTLYPPDPCFPAETWSAPIGISPLLYDNGERAHHHVMDHIYAPTTPANQHPHICRPAHSTHRAQRLSTVVDVGSLILSSPRNRASWLSPVLRGGLLALPCARAARTRSAAGGKTGRYTYRWTRAAQRARSSRDEKCSKYDDKVKMKGS